MTLGGGHHGYLGLVLLHNYYNTIIPLNASQQNSWVNPPSSGTHPNILSGATATLTKTIIHQQTEDKHRWQEYHNVHNALKTLLTQLIDPIFLCSLRHPDSGLSNIHLCDILSFLFDEYGKITPPPPPQALNDNDKVQK